jgi:hypothetical protein
MKIRSGFVSNSSSSSFLIVGKKYTLDREAFNKEVEKQEDFGSRKEDFLKFLGLPPGPNVSSFQVVHGYDYDSVMVGFGDMDLSEYDWNETDFQFIEKWRKQAEDYFGGKVDIKLLSGVENSGH